MEYSKECVECGKSFVSHSHRAMYCSLLCAGRAGEKKRKPNAVCPVCGKKFYTSRGNNLCCSQDCKMRRLHSDGKWTYYKAIEESMGIASLQQWIDNAHNIDMLPVSEIAAKLNTTRITITRWCKAWGIRTRTVSEDNARRYGMMSDDDKKAQTKKANCTIREMFKDESWKSEQIEKVLSAQSYRETKPEKSVQIFLDDIGISYSKQYKIKYYFYDIAIESKKILIEVDGEYWHSLPKQKIRDAIKDREARAHGWRLLRIPAKKSFDRQFLSDTIVPVVEL